MRVHWEQAVVAAAVVAGVLVGVGETARPPLSGWVVNEGVGAGMVAAAASLPSGQTTAWSAGMVGKPATWLALATRRPAESVPMTELIQVASDHPDDLMLVGRVDCRGVDFAIVFSMERAAAVAANPPRIDRCP